MFKGCALKSFAFVFLLTVALMLFVLPVMAQESTPEPAVIVDNDTGAVIPSDVGLPEVPNEIIAFVAFLALNAAAIVATLEKLPAYQKLTPTQKSILTFVLVAVVFPLGADLLTQFLKGLPEPQLAFINHYFGVIANGWYTWGGTFFAYTGYKRLTAPVQSA